MPNQSDPSSNKPTTPPISPVQTDLPPLPPDFQSAGSDNPVAPPINQLANQPVVPSGSAAPPDLPPVISTKPKKKFGTGRIIATILGIFLLVGGVGAGVISISNPVLYQSFAKTISHWREIGNPKARQAAKQAYDEQQAALKQAKANQSNSGTSYDPTHTLPYQSGGYLRSQVLNSRAGTNQAGWDCGGPCVQETDTDVAGYYKIDDKYYPIDVTVKETGKEKDTTTTTSDSASCQNVKAYSSTWAPLTGTQLSALTPTIVVNFCVAGTASSGSFDKAQFKINTTLEPETTTHRPSSTDFCQTYTILPADTTVSVKAKIHHATLGWQGEAI